MNKHVRFVYMNDVSGGRACIMVVRRKEYENEICNLAASFCSPVDAKRFSKKTAKSLCICRLTSERGGKYVAMTKWYGNSVKTAEHFMTMLQIEGSLPFWWKSQFNKEYES